MGKAVHFNGVTRHDVAPDYILNRSLSAGLTNVVVLGFDENGDEYIASSYAGGADMLWLMKRAEHALMRITDELAEGETE